MLLCKVAKEYKDIFIAKYNKRRVLHWVQTAGDPKDDQGTALSIDPVGNVYVAGIF